GYGGGRIVGLDEQGGIDDRLVLGVDRIGDRVLEIIVARVIFVLAIGNDARRRRHRQECFHHFDAVERILEVVNVLLQLDLTGIGDRRYHHRVHDGFDFVARIEFRVELRKARAVDAAGKWVAAGKRPPFEAAEAEQRVLRPADRFSELAVANDVDADLGLLAHDLGNGCFEAFRIGSLVEVLAGLFRGEKLAQCRGADEAADMVVRIRSVLRCIPVLRFRARRWSIQATARAPKTTARARRPALSLNFVPAAAGQELIRSSVAVADVSHRPRWGRAFASWVASLPAPHAYPRACAPGGSLPPFRAPSFWRVFPNGREVSFRGRSPRAASSSSVP